MKTMLHVLHKGNRVYIKACISKHILPKLTRQRKAGVPYG